MLLVLKDVLRFLQAASTSKYSEVLPVTAILINVLQGIKSYAKLLAVYSAVCVLG